jgi:hypothetical protein
MKFKNAWTPWTAWTNGFVKPFPAVQGRSPVVGLPGHPGQKSHATDLPRRQRRHAHGEVLRSQLRVRRHHPLPACPKRFWSFTRNAADLDQLYALLVTHAEAGHCLLKGALDRPLRHESRAGRTDPNAPTDLLVLDLDFDQGFESIDTFLEAIGLGGVSYVLHHSSSAGITAQPGCAHMSSSSSRPPWRRCS